VEVKAKPELLLLSPTATQNVELVHETPLRSLTVEGREPWVQVEPPSVEVKDSPERLFVVELGIAPTATQNVELVQETSLSSLTVKGRLPWVQVEPPSVEVTAMFTGILEGELRLSPTATQNVELVQETLVSSLTVEGRLPWVQVEPPSVDVRAMSKLLKVSPTATQNVELVHETPLRSLTVEGRVPCAQVEPPSVEVMAKPELLLLSPTATQNVELVQDTPLRLITYKGRVPWVQVEPPSVEVTTTVELLLYPTATQNVELVQETPNRCLTVEGRVPCAQVEPPSVEVMAKPELLLLSPTATQNVKLVQDTPLSWFAVG
jgi:hypothetical protein